jgi:hypothetical protein
MSEFIPVDTGPEPTTTVTTDVNHGVQAQTINGGVTMSLWPTEPELVACTPTRGDRRAAGDLYVPREGMDRARRDLRDERVALLAGRGNGWEIAALRLLETELAVKTVHLNPIRRLDSVRADELPRRGGYVWAARRRFDELAFRQAVDAVVAAEGYLVLLIEQPDEVPNALRQRVVFVGAPDAMALACMQIRDVCAPAEDKPLRVLDETFGPALRAGATPRKAVQAADLAVRQANGELSEGEALELFGEELAQAVRKWFEAERWMTEYTVMVAVAVLENMSADVVFAAAEQLELAVRAAELPADRAPRPRRVFTFARDNLLDTIGATVDRREHPRYSTLTEETVRFRRQDWARALVRHAWAQYPALQSTLVQWMVDSAEPAQGAPALCTVILDVPANDPLRHLTTLAGGARKDERVFAAVTLALLAGHFERQRLVDETLDRWIDAPAGVRRKLTAAMVLGLMYGTRPVKDGLDRLERIADTENKQLLDAVIWAVMTIRAHGRNQVPVLQTMCRWLCAPDEWDGRRVVALSVGWQVVGLGRSAGFEFPEPVEVDRPAATALTRALFGYIIRDGVFGARAIEVMIGLAERARHDPAAMRRLSDLMAMVLGDDSRRAARKALVLRHPYLRRRIGRLFRLVRLLGGRPWWAVVAGWWHGSRRAGDATGS